MTINLIYKSPNGGTISQSGYHEIPRNLADIPFHRVIYCAEERPPSKNHLGAELIYCPNDDIMCVDQNDYQTVLARAIPGVEATVSAVNEGKNVLVTCNMGLNRSGLVIALALKLLTDQSSEKIIKHIQERRLGALNNPSFNAIIRMVNRTALV